MEWNDGQVMNLSSGGLCFESIEFVKPGKDLEIMIETKDRRGQHHCRLVRAAVVWKSGPRCGVAFAKAAGAIKIK